ncbi:carboxypeptidase regulatory-like domain-containing protein [Nocardioides currus]|uniref:carboxypeptidase regulatory-like domain-containing protein n=1 Tax=Nocardioides currus TaxID=2133958 RepID=UPI000DF1D221|nr:carboxypeptidase regulatory-like domain-containing protein [Nocardioides currus]
MNSRLRRPAGALLAAAVATSVFGIVPAAHAVELWTVSGTVTGLAAAPVDRVYVSTLQEVDGEWDYVDLESASGITDVDGDYSLALPPGDYRFEFQDYESGHYLGEYYDDAPTVEQADTVVLDGDRDIDVALTPASHVAGTVSVPAGQSASGVQVSVYAATETVDGDTWWRFASGAWVEPDGSYDVGGLPAGTYRVGYEDSGFPPPRPAHQVAPPFNEPRFASEYYRDQLTVQAAQDVTVGTGATTGGINATLALPSSVSGTVTDVSNAPIAGADVRASVHGADGWDSIAYATTDASGHYTLKGLGAGTYRVEFGHEVSDTQYLYEAWNNKADIDEADDIVVSEDQDVSAIDAKLVAGEHDPLPFLEGVTIPQISGTPQVGSTLTVTKGTWNAPDSEITAAYQWWNDEGPIAGANASTYVPTATDLGKSLVVIVDASAPGYQDRTNMSTVVGPIVAAPAPPVVTPPAPPVVTPPVVTPPAPVISFSKKIDVAGALKVGSTLKLKSFKALVSRASVSYKIQWFAGAKKIKKATKSKLKVTRDLKGKKISVKVTATSGATSKTVKVKVGTIR